MVHRLLCVLAHPDDESLALGGVLARYAAEGVETYLVTATSGERGWQGLPEEQPGPQALANIREAELRAAAAVLGIRELRLLRYPDGGLASADQRALTAQIAQAVRQIRPQVVVTFGPDGATGHPDHIAISQLTTGALLCAADPAYRTSEDEPAHQVAKLYNLAPTRARLDLYERLFGAAAMVVDGSRRELSGWPEWSISAGVAWGQYAQQAWRAIRCHRSQLPRHILRTETPPAGYGSHWGATTFYRVFSLAEVAHQHEIDLFAGLRDEAQHQSELSRTAPIIGLRS